jgi:hypothetical protein
MTDDYIGLPQLLADEYRQVELPPTPLVGLDGLPCWEWDVLEDCLADRLVPGNGFVARTS